MVKIRFAGDFNADYKLLVADNLELKSLILTRIKWFHTNPEDTRLDNHELRKNMEGKSAFSITDDVRIVYRWIGTNTAEFLAIGGHKKVYGKKQA